MITPSTPCFGIFTAVSTRTLSGRVDSDETLREMPSSLSFERAGFFLLLCLRTQSIIMTTFFS